MLWVCIYFPTLATDAVRRGQPDIGEAIALVGGPAQRRTIVAASRAAVALGVRPGLSHAQAEAIANGSVVIAPYATDEVDAARQLLAGWAYGYSSQIIATLPGAIALEIEGSFRLLGPWPHVDATLRADLASLGFRHRIALAPTPHAAYVLALSADRVTARDHDSAIAALGSVDVRAAFAADAADCLQKMGIRKLRQVLRLPTAALRRRFGSDVVLVIDQLTGHARDGLVRYTPPEEANFGFTFGHDVETVQALLFPVRRLIADLAALLVARDGGVFEFSLELLHEDRRPTDVRVGLNVAERDATLLFELARGRLERIEVPASITGLRLVAKDLPPYVPQGRDLFDASPANATPWLTLRERLRAKLGDEAVYQITSTKDPRPERAWQRNDGRFVAPPLRPPRPTWLLERPIPLREQVVAVIAGPERLETGWWDGGDTRRDYYVLETARGQRAWAYCGIGERGPPWMLHGLF